MGLSWICDRCGGYDPTRQSDRPNDRCIPESWSSVTVSGESAVLCGDCSLVVLKSVKSVSDDELRRGRPIIDS